MTVQRIFVVDGGGGNKERKKIKNKKINKIRRYEFFTFVMFA